MFPLGLFEIFLLIAFTDRERLFCSQRDVPGSVENSTTFCNIQGALSIHRSCISVAVIWNNLFLSTLYPGVVFHYIALQATLLWLFHILAIFCTVKFPIRAKIFENSRYYHYAHFTMLGTAIVVPFISTAAVLATGGSTLASFPPFQCFARNSNVIYYTFILPASIMMGAGITLVILIFHIIVHVTEIRVQRRSQHVQERDLRTEVRE